VQRATIIVANDDINLILRAVVFEKVFEISKLTLVFASIKRIKEKIAPVKIELKNFYIIFFFFTKILANLLKKLPTGPCRSKTFLPLNSLIFSFKFIIYTIFN